MDALETAISRYLNNASSFRTTDLISIFPWLSLNEKSLDELLTYWLDNGYVKDQEGRYTPIPKDIETPLLFLDIDGVLNHSESGDAIDDKCLANLKEIVDKTNARIILISSWKSGWFKFDKGRQDDDANYLDERLNELGLHIEDKSSRYPTCRLLEVVDYIMKYNTSKFVILDDDVGHYRNTPLMRKLIATDYYKYGLTNELAERAISLFK